MNILKAKLQNGAWIPQSAERQPLTRDELHEKVLRLEAVMRQGETLDLEVRHTFCNGIYARELHIPKGVVVIGEIHRTENLNFLVKGDISVSTDDGIKRLQAPATIVAQRGAKRIGYAHEDTVWITLHATKETDVDKIKAIFIAPSFEALADEPPVDMIEEGG